uniref:Lecithin retinol acyltransferase n=1 Tax=Candidatus Kentrum sp. TC TaxID=2126339 RepID=A0A450Z5M5_9GAMM|nr:MAG: Lecithin retinol acyltransferase [Candidatus Kentron sp. TC]
MLNFGDILSVQYPFFAHYGIYIGNGRVIHNS